MDIARSFELSWNSLKNNKKLLLPSLIYSILFYIVIFGFLFSTGTYSKAREFTNLLVEHSRNSQDPDYLLKSKVEQDKELGRLLESRGFTFESIGKFLIDNLAWIIALVIVMIALAYAKKAAEFLMISDAVQGKKTDARALLALVPKFSFKYFLLTLAILFGIISLPIVLVVTIIALSFYISKIMGLILLLPLAFGSIVYIIYALTKALFTAPIMFLENEGVINSIKKSIQATKDKFWMCTLIGSLVLVIMWIGSYLVQIISMLVTTALRIDYFSLSVPSILLGIISSILMGIFAIFADLLLFHLYFQEKRGATIDYPAAGDFYKGKPAERNRRAKA